jgi:hypothetical protein
MIAIASMSVSGAPGMVTGITPGPAATLAIVYSFSLFPDPTKICGNSTLFYVETCASTAVLSAKQVAWTSYYYTIRVAGSRRPE